MNSHNNTSILKDLPAKQPDIQGLNELRAQLMQSRQRGLLIIEADRSQCQSWMSVFKGCGQLIILSDLDDLDSSSVPYSKAENLLGLEADSIILDLYSGMNVDVLCVALGLIKAGGLMVWFCPENVINQPDPYGQWQGKFEPRFMSYLFFALQNCPVITKVQANQLIGFNSPLPEAELAKFNDGRTQQQADLIDRMNRWLSDKKRRLFFLMAHRGRGKSTALGLFTRIHAEKRTIVITASSRAQASVLLATLDDKFSARFMAPDVLIDQSPDIDCLIIDEAAMIPLSLLNECSKRAEKVIMATTTGGYEGTGLGFQHKFMQSYNPGDYEQATLMQPIRWGQPDLLEEKFNQVLMLDPQITPARVDDNEIEYQVISKQELILDIEKLKQVYALLISAHYRTRPSDLRQLMDDDNQWVITARSGSTIVGVILLNEEGGFDAQLAEEIFMGRRRPQGHLLAQMITAQAGIRKFAQWKGLRIQRITVHEDFRRRGIGLQLVNQAKDFHRQKKLDYLGSSFALDSMLAPFWRAVGLSLIHISAGRGKSTGRQTVALLHSNSPDVKRSIQVLRQKMQRDLPVWLLGYCKNLIWRDVLALLQLSEIKMNLTALDLDELEAYSQGYLGFDFAQASLQRFLISEAQQLKLLAIDEQQLLVEKVLQNRPWSACVSVKAESGRKFLNRRIRGLIQALVQDNTK